MFSLFFGPPGCMAEEGELRQMLPQLYVTSPLQRQVILGHLPQLSCFICLHPTLEVFRAIFESCLAAVRKWINRIKTSCPWGVEKHNFNYLSHTKKSTKILIYFKSPLDFRILLYTHLESIGHCFAFTPSSDTSVAVPGTSVSSLTGTCISCSEPKKRILEDLGLNPTSILNSSGSQAADLPLPPAAPQNHDE